MTKKELLAILDKYQYIITGTSAFDLPDYIPDDIDICIDSGDEHKLLFEKFGKIAIQQYDVPFGYGGITYFRASFVIGNINYDVFAVDHNTFLTISKTTNILKTTSTEFKEMLKDKDFRLLIFADIAHKIISDLKK